MSFGAPRMVKSFQKVSIYFVQIQGEELLSTAANVFIK